MTTEEDQSHDLIQKHQQIAVHAPDRTNPTISPLNQKRTDVDSIGTAGGPYIQRGGSNQADTTEQNTQIKPQESQKR
jgi:hypothetical protein